MYIISGRGRKSGVARATGATASLAPMSIHKYSVRKVGLHTVSTVQNTTTVVVLNKSDCYLLNKAHDGSYL